MFLCFSRLFVFCISIFFFLLVKLLFKWIINPVFLYYSSYFNFLIRIKRGVWCCYLVLMAGFVMDQCVIVFQAITPPVGLRHWNDNMRYGWLSNETSRLCAQQLTVLTVPVAADTQQSLPNVYSVNKLNRKKYTHKFGPRTFGAQLTHTDSILYMMERRDSGDIQLVIDEDACESHTISTNSACDTDILMVDVNAGEITQIPQDVSTQPKAPGKSKSKQKKSTTPSTPKQPKPFKRIQTFKLNTIRSMKNTSLNVSTRGRVLLSYCLSVRGDCRCCCILFCR